MNTLQKQNWIDLLFLTVIIGGIYSIFLGSYAFVTPDEARYSEIAREMLAHGHYITPHLNGVLYFEKPIFFYWLQALSGKLFGLNEWAMRFWPACFAVLGCLGTYFTAFKLYNRRTALYASFILATSFLYFALGHQITIDMPVSVLIALCLFAFLIAVMDSEVKHVLGLDQVPRNNSRYIRAAFAFAALAVLTKGLIGIVFPCMIVGAWILILNKWRELKNWHLPSAIFIFLLIALPWHILIQIKNPQFFHFYFIDQQLLRYSTTTAERTAPIYFYFVVLLIGLFPWSPFFCQAIKHNWAKWKNRTEKQTEIFLLLWIALIFLFFTFSNSKLIPYILPIFPPIAILIGRYFATVELKKTIGLKIGFFMLSILALGFGIYLILLPRYFPITQAQLAHRYLITLVIIILTTALITPFIFRRFNFRSAFIFLNIGIITFLITTLCAIPSIDSRSIKPLAQIILKKQHKNDKVVSYAHYFQDLPFYIHQRVAVVNCHTELAFGQKYQSNPKIWFSSNDVFWKQWSNKQRLFVVADRDDYEMMRKQHPNLKFYLLGQTVRSVLVSNQKM